MRQYLKEPIPEIFSAYFALSKAVDAHLTGDYKQAAVCFDKANSPEVWDWLNSSWMNVEQHVVTMKPISDTQIVPREDRDPDRNIASAIKRRVLERDGHRCRYCGLPVIHADIRKIAHTLYPEVVPWHPNDAKLQHAAFQVFWLQFDHVEPHSHGGRSTAENVVVTCALCNFGKDRFTLRQLDLEDPRLRPPVPSEFEGLERFRAAAPSRQRQTPQETNAEAFAKVTREDGQPDSAFFFPGAWIGGNYVNIPPLQGKSRWFKLGANVSAEPVVRNGVEGCVVTCPRVHLERRGLDVEALLDKGPDN
ncbi:MAG: HNH endonuclease [Paracoccaceae bacterium]|nr:HNH endonuclease [Paracoccaceae bacterium]